MTSKVFALDTNRVSNGTAPYLTKTSIQTVGGCDFSVAVPVRWLVSELSQTR
jgi:hypothetical protein